MTTFLVLSFVALLIYGLERNHRRQTFRTRLAGSSHVEDRDAARVRADTAASAIRRRLTRHTRRWPAAARLRTRTL